MKLRSRKGATEQTLQVIFAVVVAFGIIMIVLLQAIFNLGGATYLQKYYSADAALTMDAVHAVKKGTNLQFTYSKPATSLKYETNKVISYRENPQDGEHFYFTQDRDKIYSFGNFGNDVSNIIYFREGKNVGVAKNKNIMPLAVDCPDLPLQLNPNQQAFAHLSQVPFQINRDPNVYVSIHQSKDKTLRAYANNEEAAKIACKITQELQKVITDLEGYAITKTNKDLDTGIQKTISGKDEPSVILEFYYPQLSQAKTGMAFAMGGSR